MGASKKLIDGHLSSASLRYPHICIGKELQRIQTVGFATDDRENEPLGACVAAVILGRNRSPVGAISVAGPDFRIRPRFEEIGSQVRDAAAAVSRDLGVVMAEEGE